LKVVFSALGCWPRGKIKTLDGVSVVSVVDVAESDSGN
jgi:hypothetical protein